MTPIEWLTLGLVVFAAVQVAVQLRSEVVRKKELKADKEEALDQAFHYAWAEHFRLSSLADVMRRSDLIEMALLGLLRPEDVRPADTVQFLKALAQSGREAGVLGGFFLGASVDVERSVGLLVRSVQAFAKEAPTGLTDAGRVKWIRTKYGKHLEPWEKSTRTLVEDLANVAWDAIQHSPRTRVYRELRFSDALTSKMSEAAVKALARQMAVGSALEKEPDAE